MALLHKIDNATLARALAGKHPPARLADGGGVYLTIRDGRPPRWLFRYLVESRQHYVGLGRLCDVPARAARARAAALRAQIGQGDYPHAEAEDGNGGPQESDGVPLRTAIAEFLAIRPPSKNAAHARQWEQTMR